ERQTLERGRLVRAGRGRVVEDERVPIELLRAGARCAVELQLTAGHRHGERGESEGQVDPRGLDAEPAVRALAQADQVDVDRRRDAAARAGGPQRDDSRLERGGAVDPGGGCDGLAARGDGDLADVDGAGGGGGEDVGEGDLDGAGDVEVECLVD